MITVLLRGEHHIDHTFVEATTYRDEAGVLTVWEGEREVARFAPGSWDGVYLHTSTQVREGSGHLRPAGALLSERAPVPAAAPE